MVYHINQENWKLGMCNILEWSMNSNKKSKFINECKDHAEVCADLWDAPDDPCSLVFSPLCSPSHRERALLLSLSLFSLSLFSLPQQKDSYHVLSSPMERPMREKTKAPCQQPCGSGDPWKWVLQPQSSIQRAAIPVSRQTVISERCSESESPSKDASTFLDLKNCLR